MKNYHNSYNQVKNAIESGKADNIYNLIDGFYNSPEIFRYSDTAMVVFDLLKVNGEDSVIDICNRVIDSIKKGYQIVISDEQRWGLASAALQISPSCVDLLREADSALIENDDDVRSTYRVQYSTQIESSIIIETTDEAVAKAEFAKYRDQLAQNTPADISGWKEANQAWNNVFFAELVRVDSDETGYIIDMVTLDETEYYYI